MSAAPGVPGYYGEPVVERPVWKPSIALYFFAGGLAGASALLGFGARLAGNDRLARRCVLAAAAGAAVSPPLLIEDLGRPERFLHMLRMVKPTSPMSIGTWVLSGFGAASGAAALSELTGRLPGAGRLAEGAAALLGLPLATYTAVLIATTSIPAWRRARFHLPPLFASTAAATAGALATATTPHRDSAPAAYLAATGAAGSAVTMRLMERHLGDDAAPYRMGAASVPARFAPPAMLLGAAGVLAGRRWRPAGLAGAGLILAGGLAERLAVYLAGPDSASRTLR